MHTIDTQYDFIIYFLKPLEKSPSPHSNCDIDYYWLLAIGDCFDITHNEYVILVSCYVFTCV